MACEIRRYRTVAGDEPFTQWLGALVDRQARARVLVRLERLALGNAGDARYLRDGVSELRIDWGPGYRVYFGREGNSLVVLLCGGDKRRQAVDVERAVKLWHEHENRNKAPPRVKR
ncbi:MAG: type II toxin-antitoxin system RelE/ParE family toxin [Burkholderiales bacterium]